MKWLPRLAAPEIVTVSIAGHVIPRVLLADSFFARVRGWYGYQRRCIDRNSAGTGIDAVLLTQTASIQTMCMSFALDLLWLDHEFNCIGLTQGVPPWRVHWCQHACHVLEIACNSETSLLFDRCLPGQQLRLLGRTLCNPGKEA